MEIEFSSCGDTPKEALENLREAIDLWLKNPGLLGLYLMLFPLLPRQKNLLLPSRLRLHENYSMSPHIFS